MNEYALPAWNATTLMIRPALRDGNIQFAHAAATYGALQIARMAVESDASMREKFGREYGLIGLHALLAVELD